MLAYFLNASKNLFGPKTKKNTWGKFTKESKVRPLILFQFSSSIAKYYFWKGDLALGWKTLKLEIFLECPLFPKMVSLDSLHHS